MDIISFARLVSILTSSPLRIAPCTNCVHRSTLGLNTSAPCPKASRAITFINRLRCSNSTARLDIRTLSEGRGDQGLLPPSLCNFDCSSIESAFQIPICRALHNAWEANLALDPSSVRRLVLYSLYRTVTPDSSFYPTRLRFCSASSLQHPFLDVTSLSFPPPSSAGRRRNHQAHILQCLPPSGAPGSWL